MDTFSGPIKMPTEVEQILIDKSLLQAQKHPVDSSSCRMKALRKQESKVFLLISV